MKHTLPVGGGELYEKIGVNPHDEWNEITAKYGAKKHNYREYGRLAFVTRKANRLIHMINKTGEFFAKSRQGWKDRDFSNRAKRKVKNLFTK
jgi:hypothetical protein